MSVTRYTCDMDDFSSDDLTSAALHALEANRHVQSRWWRHTIITETPEELEE